MASDGRARPRWRVSSLGSVRIRTASLTRALNLVTVRRRAARLLLLRLTISSVHEVVTLLFAIAGLTVCALLLTPLFVLICELGRGAVLHALVLLVLLVALLALLLVLILVILGVHIFLVIAVRALTIAALLCDALSTGC
jgi:hypothetical protein